MPLAGFFVTGTSAVIAPGTVSIGYTEEDIPVLFAAGSAEPAPLVVPADAPAPAPTAVAAATPTAD